MKPAQKISGGIIIACGLWLAAVNNATTLMIHYSNTPSNTGLAPAIWPGASTISCDSRRPTLIMFAHPHCPCTRASLSELARLLTQTPDKLNTYVVFLKPEET